MIKSTFANIWTNGVFAKYLLSHLSNDHSHRMLETILHTQQIPKFSFLFPCQLIELCQLFHYARCETKCFYKIKFVCLFSSFCLALQNVPFICAQYIFHIFRSYIHIYIYIDLHYNHHHFHHLYHHHIIMCIMYHHLCIVYHQLCHHHHDISCLSQHSLETVTNYSPTTQPTASINKKRQIPPHHRRCNHPFLFFVKMYHKFKEITLFWSKTKTCQHSYI